MHDIKFIRENPAAFDEAMKKRGLPPQADAILKLDKEKRQLQTELQELQSKRNQLAKEVGMAKAKGGDAAAIMAEAKTVNERITFIEAKATEEDELTKLLMSLPNMTAPDVPSGKDETANVKIREHGKKPTFSFKPKEHFELGENLELMDFERATRMSGTRFVLLKAQLARLERALANFMLDTHTQQFGFIEIAPPFLVRNNALYGTGQLPKFEADLFKTTTEHYLIPTSEVTLCNIVADEIINEDTLPLRFTAYTPCFRSEAGSAGKDTRGMIRQHQFTKVEMVSITHPDKSEDEQNYITSCAEEILKRLGLHYQVIKLCSGDTGFGMKRTYDIEVWLPGQDAYREISSCSTAGDFQARRLKARYRPKDSKNTQFVHTLNGSGLAVGRTMIAVMENYQHEDGSIQIPEALQTYMDGLTVIKQIP